MGEVEDELLGLGNQRLDVALEIGGNVKGQMADAFHQDRVFGRSGLKLQYGRSSGRRKRGHEDSFCKCVWARIQPLPTIINATRQVATGKSCPPVGLL